MNDLKKFEHIDGITHYACEDQLKKYRGKTPCCECTKHKCPLKRFKQIKKAIK